MGFASSPAHSPVADETARRRKTAMIVRPRVPRTSQARSEIVLIPTAACPEPGPVTTCPFRKKASIPIPNHRTHEGFVFGLQTYEQCHRTAGLPPVSSHPLPGSPNRAPPMNRPSDNAPQNEEAESSLAPDDPSRDQNHDETRTNPSVPSVIADDRERDAEAGAEKPEADQVDPSIPPTALNLGDANQSPKERQTVRKLTEAYMQDEALPEELARARASAEVNRLAGRTDGTFDAASGTLTSGEEG